MDQLIACFKDDSPCLVLTGAGCSTASGLGDYRDKAGQWKRKQPMTAQQFIGDEASRKRYWARSFTGWPQFANAQPNASHHALVSLQQRGFLQQLVTQNVDGLHQLAGHKDVIDLHGRLDQVVCISCGSLQKRNDFQHTLLQNNADLAGLSADNAPDGDADLELDSFEWLKVPPCSSCQGILKPDVVFFGENVPKMTVQTAMQQLSEASSLVVVGSSLMVYSGLRFAKAAAKLGKPIGVINQGTTRADDLLDWKLEQDCGTALNTLLEQL